MAKLNGVEVRDMQNGEITKIAYDGAEYVLFGGSPQVGDLIRPHSDEWYGNPDGFYVCKSLDDDGDAEIITDRNNEDGHFRRYYDVFRKVAAEPTQVSPPFAEMITEQIRDVGARVGKLESRVDALEAAPAKPKLKVGDYAKVVRDIYEYKAGDIIKITGDRTNSDATVFDFKVNKIAKRHYGYIDAKDITTATDAEIAEAKATAEKADASAKKVPKLTEGDFARTLKDGEFGDVKAGTIVEITDLDCGGSYDPYEIEVERPDGQHDYFRPQDLELIGTKDAVFANIGRKTNEFKKGDLVEITRYQCGHPVGAVVTVEEVQANRVNAYGLTGQVCNRYFADFDAIKLIAPVESRVDAK